LVDVVITMGSRERSLTSSPLTGEDRGEGDLFYPLTLTLSRQGERTRLVASFSKRNILAD
jgi:hypothetical protein